MRTDPPSPERRSLHSVAVRHPEASHRSYRERISALRAEKDVDAAASLLFSPADYAEASAQTQEFDAVVSYEEVRDALNSLGVWGAEAALVVDHAILQYRRGGVRSPDDPQRTRFFAELASGAAARGLPELPPIARKAQAGFLWYPRDATLTQPRGWDTVNASQGVWLVAKMLRGDVDIELTSISRRLPPARIMEVFADAPFLAIGTKAGVIIRAKAEPLNPNLPYEEQRDAAESVIDALLSLRAWWEGEGRRGLEALLAEVPDPERGGRR